MRAFAWSVLKARIAQYGRHPAHGPDSFFDSWLSANARAARLAGKKRPEAMDD